jgi:hypothetical protein
MDPVSATHVFGAMIELPLKALVTEEIEGGEAP